MKLTRPIVALALVLTTGAFLGLLSIEFYLLRQAYDAKLQAFERNVQGALDSVVKRLEEGETLNRVVKLTALARSDAGGTHAMFTIWEDGRETDAYQLLLRAYQGGSRVQAEGLHVIVQLQQPERMKLVSLGTDTTPGNEIRILADPRNVDASLAGDGVVVFDEFRPAGRYDLPLSCQARTGVCRYRLFVADLAHEIVADRDAIRHIFVVSTQALTQFAVIDKILEQFMNAEPVPIATRVDRRTLETTVRSALSSFNVTTDCAFGILSAKDGTVVLSNPESSGAALARAPFRARLFQNDVRPGQYDLVCDFPSQRSALLRQLGPSAATSLLFILVTLGCFTFIVTAVFSQQRFSLLLTEFINNMAHEFKTPISTISLAADAIGRSAGGADQERLSRYSRIIQEEATRMRHQVEKILEMAVLERKESGFRMSEVDLHALIGKAVDHFAPEIEKRSGRVTTALGAGTPRVEGDEVHLLNVLRNLLDNALKYNARAPDLHIATSNTAHGVVISVGDNGIGMRPDDMKRIWDRYYRVQRGNVHDVKGFGLGLSYVKRVVEAHGGAVRVASEERAGSVFDIELPFRGGSAIMRRRRPDEPRPA